MPFTIGQDTTNAAEVVAPWSADKIVFSRRWVGGFTGAASTDTGEYQIAWPMDYRQHGANQGTSATTREAIWYWMKGFSYPAPLLYKQVLADPGGTVRKGLPFGMTSITVINNYIVLGGTYF